MGTLLRQDAAVEEAKVVRFRKAASAVAASPRPAKAVSQKTIAPRPITDEVVG